MMHPDPEQLRKARKLLLARCRYEEKPPSFRLPKIVIRLVLAVLALGFGGLGLACVQPVSTGASLLIGSVFLGLALLI
jgi:hypothetical protein